MIQYILSYITKGQQGLSDIKECTCQEARIAEIGLKASVRHMGNAFLYGVEIIQQEAVCLWLLLLYIQPIYT